MKNPVCNLFVLFRADKDYVRIHIIKQHVDKPDYFFSAEFFQLVTAAYRYAYEKIIAFNVDSLKYFHISFCNQLAADMSFKIGKKHRCKSECNPGKIGHNGKSFWNQTPE